MLRRVMIGALALWSGSAGAQEFPYTYEPTSKRFSRMAEAAKLDTYRADFDFCSGIIREFVARKNPQQMIEKLSRSENPERGLAFAIEVSNMMNETHKNCMVDRGYTARPKP